MLGLVELFRLADSLNESIKGAELGLLAVLGLLGSLGLWGLLGSGLTWREPRSKRW